jgi:hypothetical protein
VSFTTDVGALDWDLRSACLRALTMSPDACRAFALGMTWEARARAFIDNAPRTTAQDHSGGQSGQARSQAGIVAASRGARSISARVAEARGLN